MATEVAAAAPHAPTALSTQLLPPPPSTANSKVFRSIADLKVAVACDLCGGVPRDPHISTQCMHTACYACFAEHWEWDGKANCCPLCAKAGIVTLWGPYPDAGEVPRLRRDLAMVSLMRKLFPRPGVDEEIRERQRMEIERVIEGRKYKPSRAEAAAMPRSYDHHVPLLALRAPSSADATDDMESGPTADGTAELKRPYVMVPWDATVATMSQYILDRLRQEGLPGGEGGDTLPVLLCNGCPLDPQDTLRTVYEARWAKGVPLDPVMQLQYRTER